MRTSQLLLFFSVILAVPAVNAAGAKDCVHSAKGAKFIDGVCMCPTDFQLDKNGICEAAQCKTKVDKPAAVVAKAPKKASKPKVVAESVPPTCIISKGERYAAAAGEAVTFDVTCNPGSKPIDLVSADCTDCKIADGLGQASTVNRIQLKPKKGQKQERVIETFVVSPISKEKDSVGSVIVKAKDKDGAIDTQSLAIKWPAEKKEPERSPYQIACERDGYKYFAATATAVEYCDCPAPLKLEPWTDGFGNLHLCKNPPPPPPINGINGDKGADGVTTIIYKGDTSHLTLGLEFVGIMIDKSLATGMGIVGGYAWGFGPESKWHFKVAGGLLIMPTPEYQGNGAVVRDSSGTPVKNNTGFLAAATVSYALSSNWAIGAGPSYKRLGQHYSGDNTGIGTYEFLGGRADLIWYPLRGQTATMGLVLSPEIGALTGGKNPDARTSSAVTLGVQILL